jgi:hypothetical protein
LDQPAARPFLNVIYGVICCRDRSIIGIWWPAEVFQAAENLSKLLNAVPESLCGSLVPATLATPAREASTSGAVCPGRQHQRLQQTHSSKP